MWEFRRAGRKLEEIGQQLGVTRQAVCRALHISDSRIQKVFREMAEAYKVIPREVHSQKGFLRGYSQVLASDVLLVYSADQGVQVWYKTAARCEGCRLAQSCRRSLLKHAERLGVALSERESSMLPARLSQIVFERAWPELQARKGE